ncbi:hypothetical protein F4692_002953 [Nocardioides cavernae]|uniref:DUF2470 domain-containing protein n=1 Tax=Nocardioides cavernae TaxID=1921566 RepID=A0A7Y9H4K3_9ACTN|nr:hypothetical protein [Nocardioides cavernae]NYE37820.1 hypothetical protein [Nocardioides cavernae]
MTPAETALIARSVLSCPRSITLRVDDSSPALEEEGYEVTTDVHGAPVFSAAQGSALVAGAHTGAEGVVEVSSGLGHRSSRERGLGLVLRGRLAQRGSGCACCGDTRALVAVDLAEVTLLRGTLAIQVDLDEFRDGSHVLNQGYLQRTAEHANEAHERELRTATASTFGLPLRTLLAASLRAVDPDGVEVAWLDDSGAHTQRLDFLRRASTPQELGAALRTHLHAGLC